MVGACEPYALCSALKLATLLGGGLTLLLALLQLLSRRGRDRLYRTGLFIFTAIWLLIEPTPGPGGVREQSWLQALDGAALYCALVFAWLCTRWVFEDRARIQRGLLWLLPAPALIGALPGLVILLPTALEWGALIFDLAAAPFLALTLERPLRSLADRGRQDGRIQALTLVISGALAALFVHLAGHILQSSLLGRIGGALVALAAVYIYLLQRVHPRLIDFLRFEARRLEIRAQQSLTIDAAGVERQLNYLMNVERLYQHPRLSLADLAQAAGLHPHLLSRFFAERLRSNFGHYVDAYRLREYYNLLLENASPGSEDAARRAGFESVVACERARVRSSVRDAV